MTDFILMCSRSDCEFSLSLNGSELLTDSGQTLSSCSIVCGDLISVLLPQTEADTQNSSNSSTSRTSSSSENRHPAAMTTNQVRDSPVNQFIYKDRLLSTKLH